MNSVFMPVHMLRKGGRGDQNLGPGDKPSQPMPLRFPPVPAVFWFTLDIHKRCTDHHGVEVEGVRRYTHTQLSHNGQWHLNQVTPLAEPQCPHLRKGKSSYSQHLPTCPLQNHLLLGFPGAAGWTSGSVCACECACTHACVCEGH